jgi:XTP/dITP diphosphohydrolase
MTKICFATNNKHKLEEVRQILTPDFRVLSLAEINCLDDLPETANTFEGNSKQKAKYVFDRFHIPCFADDSGLEVNALGGEPGVFSARYAGEQRSDEDNIQLVLKKLVGINNRNARFNTVVTFIDNQQAATFEGTIEGSIIDYKRGSNGFGYDPIFVPSGHSKTFAELTSEEKNSMSHRSVAVRKLSSFLKEYFIS